MLSSPTVVLLLFLFRDLLLSLPTVVLMLLYRDLLLSPPTVVLMCCEFANSWGLYTLVTLGPTFFKEVLNFDISQV